MEKTPSPMRRRNMINMVVGRETAVFAKLILHLYMYGRTTAA
jgi:hypothetical protein